MRKIFDKAFLIFTILLLHQSCKIKNKNASTEDINALKLKRGDLVLCSPADAKFGLVSFDVSCSEKVRNDFNLAVAILHSFEYDEAEKVFAKIIDEEPGCAMAYWGVAMCNFHPLWTPSTGPELEKGAKAIAIARSLGQTSERESAYIEAIGMYFKDADKTDHLTRCIRFEKAMEVIAGFATPLAQGPRTVCVMTR